MSKIDELNSENVTAEIIKKVESGATDMKIYKALGVTNKTFDKWKAEHQEEYELAKQNAHIKALTKVEGKLNKKVIGGWRRKEKYEVIDGEEVLVSVERTQVDPSENAIIFWLRSHAPEIYDRVTMRRLELEEKSTDGIQEIVQGLSQFDVKNYKSDEPEVTESEILALLDREVDE
ncbi:bacteriophage terminase small subunit [Lactococcus garvieae]|uniref:bacteriophage terminase small subunit n=1 Tax=Lactococcus garvieae TaxID=1363 RepID=UPI0037C4FA3C